MPAPSDSLNQPLLSKDKDNKNKENRQEEPEILASVDEKTPPKDNNDDEELKPFAQETEALPQGSKEEKPIQPAEAKSTCFGLSIPTIKKALEISEILFLTIVGATAARDVDQYFNKTQDQNEIPVYFWVGLAITFIAEGIQFLGKAEMEAKEEKVSQNENSNLKVPCNVKALLFMGAFLSAFSGIVTRVASKEIVALHVARWWFKENDWTPFFIAATLVGLADELAEVATSLPLDPKKIPELTLRKIPHILALGMLHPANALTFTNKSIPEEYQNLDGEEKGLSATYLTAPLTSSQMSMLVVGIIRSLVNFCFPVLVGAIVIDELAENALGISKLESDKEAPYIGLALSFIYMGVTLLGASRLEKRPFVGGENAEKRLYALAAGTENFLGEIVACCCKSSNDQNLEEVSITYTTRALQFVFSLVGMASGMAIIAGENALTANEVYQQASGSQSPKDILLYIVCGVTFFTEGIKIGLGDTVTREEFFEPGWAGVLKRLKLAVVHPKSAMQIACRGEAYFGNVVEGEVIKGSQQGGEGKNNSADDQAADTVNNGDEFSEVKASGSTNPAPGQDADDSAITIHVQTSPKESSSASNNDLVVQAAGEEKSSGNSSINEAPTTKNSVSEEQKASQIVIDPDKTLDVKVHIPSETPKSGNRPAQAKAGSVSPIGKAGTFLPPPLAILPAVQSDGNQQPLTLKIQVEDQTAKVSSTPAVVVGSNNLSL